MTRGVRFVAVLVGVGLAGCVTNPVGPVTGADAFTTKAKRTVTDVRSAAGSARLVADAEVTGRSFRSFAGPVVDGALDSVVAAEDTFETIVPPDDASRELRGRVLDTVVATRKALADLRTALPGDDAAVATAAGGLGPVIARLEELDGELG
jgi:hypothetical protein